MLAGIEQLDGMAKQWKEILENNKGIEKIYSETYGKNYEIGDFVIFLDDFLAEIIDKHTGPFGYISYTVKFFERSPIGLDVEWVHPNTIKLILPKKHRRESLRKVLESVETSVDVSNLSEEELEKLFRKSAKEFTKDLFKIKKKQLGEVFGILE